MTTAYTTLLGLAQPVTGELSGTWGATVNDYITTYLDSAVAGTQTISGTQTAVTLSVTNGSTLVSAGAGATGSSQYMVINCTGTPASLLTITAPGASKVYVVINATAQSVKLVGTGPTAGVTLVASEKAVCSWNGTDFVKVASSAVTALTGILLPANGGTGIANNAASTLTISGSFATTLTVSGTTGVTLPTTGTLATLAGSETLSNKTLTAPLLGTPTSGNLGNCTQDGTNTVGFLIIPQNSQSAAYTLVLADAGKHIFHPSTDANARTYTIPANGTVAYTIGTAITFINMTSQVVTIAITTDTMYLSSAGTTGSRSLAQYGSATAIKMTATTWLISGSGLT